MESGTAKGYTERHIIDAIICANQARFRLPNYLEGRENLTLAVIQSIIRGFYRETSSTELPQELCNLKQNGQESTQEFLFRAENKIFIKGEWILEDTSLVDNQYKHCLKH